MKLNAFLIPRSTIISILMCLTLSGCAFNSIFINYPSQIIPYKQQINSPIPSLDLDDIANEIDSNDGLLYAQESGRLAQINGSFEQSKHYYQQAIEAYKAFDDKAKISVTDMGSKASSLLLNDNAIPYRGPGYERIMLHQYQALNYLFSGDSQGAMVELRRSNELQSSEQARYQKSQKSVQAMANGTIDAEVNKLGQSAGTVTSSFLNAYSYYTTGLLYELLGEPNDAFIDYRKAAQISPNNKYLQQDLVRLAKQLSMPQYDDFSRRWGDAVLATPKQGQVVFLIERGFVPEKQSLTVPFTIDGNWQTVSLATYQPAMNNSAPVSIQGLGSVLKAETIANIDALAINALKEDLPAALVRQALRVYAKAEMAQSVRSESKRRNDQIDAGVIAMQIFNVITEQADRRSWLTLPNNAQIARQYVDPGEYEISLDNTQKTKIEIKSDKTTLIWVIDTGTRTRFYSIIL
ncbi:COG3014 family protein [Shewanella sp. HL-SH4]|uniref:COG3014 family protein n=1 Tax=Shewanella sp. HL-SH4 TaxID=3436240 RepID=UPI003EBA6DD9